MAVVVRLAKCRRVRRVLRRLGEGPTEMVEVLSRDASHTDSATPRSEALATASSPQRGSTVLFTATSGHLNYTITDHTNLYCLLYYANVYLRRYTLINAVGALIGAVNSLPILPRGSVLRLGAPLDHGSRVHLRKLGEARLDWRIHALVPVQADEKENKCLRRQSGSGFVYSQRRRRSTQTPWTQSSG